MNAVLVITTRDNVATALEPLEPGRTIQVGESTLRIADDIPRGHKVALAAIDAGDPVIKYGSSIGIASAPIAPGAHVHTHNVASTRGRGDLKSVAGSVHHSSSASTDDGAGGADPARLAEPAE